MYIVILTTAPTQTKFQPFKEELSIGKLFYDSLINTIIHGLLFSTLSYLKTIRNFPKVCISHQKYVHQTHLHHTIVIIYAKNFDTQFHTCTYMHSKHFDLISRAGDKHKTILIDSQSFWEGNISSAKGGDETTRGMKHRNAMVL